MSAARRVAKLNALFVDLREDLERGNIAMKISRILPAVGILTLLASSAAFTLSPPIPPGAGVGVDRQPPGSGWRDPANPVPTTSPDKRAISLSCSQQADAKRLQGEARKAFRSQCERSGGH